MADDAFAKLLYDQVLNNIEAGIPVSDEQWSYLELFDFVYEGITPTMSLPIEGYPAIIEIGGLLPQEYDRAAGKLRRQNLYERKVRPNVTYPLRPPSW